MRAAKGPCLENLPSGTQGRGLPSVPHRHQVSRRLSPSGGWPPDFPSSLPLCRGRLGPVGPLGSLLRDLRAKPSITPPPLPQPH